MNDKIIMLKTCGDSIYGVNSERDIFVLENIIKDDISDINYSKKMIIENIDWSHDFCFIDNVLYYIKDRKIFDEKGGKKLDLDYPIKIKSKNERIYILDQEQSSVLVYDKSFNLLETIGRLGIDKLEKPYETVFHFPIDFDVFEDHIGVIDTGNRRIVILKGDKKFVFPILGKKLQFFDKNTALILYGETIYKIDLTDNKILKTEYNGIIDFCVDNRTNTLIVSREYPELDN